MEINKIEIGEELYKNLRIKKMITKIGTMFSDDDDDGGIYQYGGTVQIDSPQKLTVGERVSVDDNGDVVSCKHNDDFAIGIVLNSSDKDGKVEIALAGGTWNLDLQRQLNMIKEPGKAALGLFSKYPEVVELAKELIEEQKNGK